LIKGQTLTIN